jgi:hypothetical protein
VDTTRFDNLTRSLAGGTSRRRLLAGLGALTAGLLGLRTTGSAATCPPGRVFRRGVGCVCRQTGRPPVKGICPCPRGQTDTGDGLGCLECRSPADCPAPANGQPFCAAGACSFACDQGFHRCGGVCASDADPATCGDRCAPCPAPGICDQTVEGTFVCTGSALGCPTSPSCTSTTDCPTGLTCNGGHCLGSCSADGDCASYYPFGTHVICGSNGYCVSCDSSSDCPDGFVCGGNPGCVDGRICLGLA